MSDKTRTGAENGSRMIYDVGCYELPKKKAQTQAKMFQYIKSKRKGRRKCQQQHLETETEQFQ